MFLRVRPLVIDSIQSRNVYRPSSATASIGTSCVFMGYLSDSESYGVRLEVSGGPFVISGNGISHYKGQSIGI